MDFAPPALVDIPDDDDMPPLVDQPPALAMMTYTFGNDFTPLSFSAPAEPCRFELLPDDETPRIYASPPFEDAETGAIVGAGAARSHAKKRDASYIPRPPNAFILFRSSFIKSQQIPGKIEGNHSTLSKIIGALSDLLHVARCS
ncbi:hypothetical protein FA95DRAFT_1562003 [Auriscalpium vulgare]|uniref:Uncharacterized protein n=1 Tax=Auriscalpium vulgare TaxID=40419 RepID=A0ACB8RLZ2_9AGAM|nr:hypothetical protein FA95DRAFT_1562003 [Auriscalpium vulgare]